MATTPIVVEQIESRVAQLMPTAVQERSALTMAGATNIAIGTGLLRTLSVGGPALMGQGEQKSLSDSVLKDVEVMRQKLVHIFLATEEARRDSNWDTFLTQQLALGTAGLVRGADVVVLNGTNPADGVANAKLAGVNLKANAKQHVAGADVDADLIALLTEARKATGVIFSDAGYAKAAFARNDGGATLYPAATKSGKFTVIGGTDAVYSSALGVDGWTATDEIDNANLAVAGPWPTVARAFSPVTVRTAQDGIVRGINLTETNTVAIIMESFLEFAITYPGDFSIMKAA